MRTKQGIRESKIKNSPLETTEHVKNCLSPVTTLSENTEKSYSSPRRKRNELSFLHSDLSPKYIGFLTSPNDNESKRKSRLNISEGSIGSLKEVPINKSVISNLLITPTVTETVSQSSCYHQKGSGKNKKQNKMAIQRKQEADITKQSQDINDNQIENNLEYYKSLCLAENNFINQVTIEPIITDSTKVHDVSINNIQYCEKDIKTEEDISLILTNTFEYTNSKLSNAVDIEADMSSYENYDKKAFDIETNNTLSPTNTNSFNDDSTSTSTSTLVGNSTSIESRDSANGSSVDTEANINILAGELFWGQMAQYPYWPCIVCPDPDGKTISVKGAKQHKQHAMIHVRFFADNGRRGWVKKTNLIVYEGCEAYMQKVDEIKTKIEPMKSKLNILKLYVINNPKNKSLWLQAVNEADLILPIPIENRILKFEEVVKNMKELNQVAKQRRISIDYNSRSLSSERNRYVFRSTDDLFKVNKRQRSPTPESPAYEPIYSFKNSVSKKPKTILSDRIDAEDSILQYLKEDLTKNWINNVEFNELKDVLKGYVFGGVLNYSNIIEDKLNVAIRQIWNLKEISTKFMKKQDTELNDNSKNLKINKIQRMSQRLEKISQSQVMKSSSNELISLPIVPKEKKLQRKTLLVDEVIDAIFNLDKNYLFKGLLKSSVCIVCQNPGDLEKCNGNCFGLLHTKCGEIKSMDIESNDTPQNLEDSKNQLVITSDVICPSCAFNEEPKCFVCKVNKGERIRCHSKECGKYFHQSCLQYWPQAKFLKSGSKEDCLFCPAHICHTCVSDDPKKNFVEIEKSKLIRCIDCPATYHMDSTCIPAGSEFITASQIKCPKHFRNPRIVHVNVNWCFFCVKGGKLICCETCPTAFHIECLHLESLPEVFICEECETGRMPLYGEIVWAKFNNFRWWPSIIIPPPLVPKNLVAKKRYPSEFLIRFFGTNDHGWINRQRVYLYQDGDFKEENFRRSRSNLDSNYVRGVEEACRVAELIKQKFPQKPSKSKKLKICPLPYFKLKVNRSVPPVRIIECDLNEVNVCECNPDMINPCGPESGCLNRMLLIECNPKVCPAGSKCQNQLFEKRSYQQLDTVYMNEKGFGLVCLQPISAGTFIIEYIGEIINDKELRKRIELKQHEKDENYYFLTVEKDYIIDAGLKGNMARFMNHSCEPNCETQKWTVNGVNRVGLFAIKDLPVNTELTFNYYLECIGSGKKPCHCGAKKCAGYIGSKYIEPVKGKLKERDDLLLTNPKTKRSVGRQLKVKTTSKVTKQPKKKSKKKKDIFVKLVKDDLKLKIG